MKKALWLWLVLMMLAPLAQAGPKGAVAAPETLAPWSDWVLEGYEDQYYCPKAQGKRRCAWPLTLSLDLGQKGGSFTAQFELLTEGTFPLPGEREAWPQEVTDEKGRPAPVLGDEAPAVWLPAGRHSLSGRFVWAERPQTLVVPLGFIINLKVDGQPLAFPGFNADYGRGSARLWLGERGGGRGAEADSGAAEGDSLMVRVDRLIVDSQPMMIRSRFRLTVSGQPREVFLENAILPETRATHLSSPLPAQLTAKGLRVRVRPGLHEIFIDSRALGPSESLGPMAPSARWDAELWAFQGRPELRLAEISGAPQVDPSQTDIYHNWRGFPVYALSPGQALNFHTIRRGDPDPPPDQLNLARECWLDYDGQGLSCRDRLTGLLGRRWSLVAARPFTLAQASLDGQPQVITWQTDSHGNDAPGLQLRSGRVDLSADLRIDDFNGRLPASGWDRKLDTEGQRLNLPPGYHLFHASGAEVRQSSAHSGAGTWTGAWGTLDFFLVLVISIAVWRLYGPRWGAVALLALIFCYHEPLAPRLVFLHLLASTALMALVPENRFRRLVGVWRGGAVVCLLIFSALFIIHQVKVTLYPQLENPQAWPDDRAGLTSFTARDHGYDRGSYAPVEPPRRAPAPMALETAGGEEYAVEEQHSYEAKAVTRSKSPASGASFANRATTLSLMPDAVAQNSLARPGWHWRSVRLYYNGSVTADQTVGLYFITPAVWRGLGLLRIVLLSLLVMGLLRVSIRLKPVAEDQAQGQTRQSLGRAGAIVAAACAALTLAAPPALAADFPDSALLNEFRQRLLSEKPVPPANFSRLNLTAGPERLVMEFWAEAAEAAVLPLPSIGRDIFRPEKVALDGGDDLPVLEDGAAWFTYVPQGRHRVVVEGPLRPGAESFQINFSLRPRLVTADGGAAWSISGFDGNGQLTGHSLNFSSTQAAPSPAAEAATSQTLEPFFMVQRTITLGLQWQVITTVRRLTPADSPVSLRLPLLPGEHPTTDAVRREGAEAVVNIPRDRLEVTWASRLDQTPEITLTAAEGPYTESWRLDAAPIWRVAHRGLGPIQTLSDGFWQPTWRPWPGERLSLSIDRPRPAPGQHLAIDQAELVVNAAENSRSCTLDFTLRTSQAGPYSFRLPPGAEVKSFTVDGRPVPMSPEMGQDGEGPLLTAALSVGEHHLAAAWSVDEAMETIVQTPAMDLGELTANLTLRLNMPEDRWVLWVWGPLNGPAVQFWPLGLALIPLAWALGRYGPTPLGWGGWFLLGLGLIQINILGALAVVGWLLALGRRGQGGGPAGWLKFNGVQILLAVWTFAALYFIYKGIEYGLLSNPDMLIEGGGSYGQRLTWFIDRAPGLWPQGGSLSVPVWVYKALMLLWSLWLAVRLIDIFRWGWRSFSGGGLWKKKRPKKGRSPAADSEI